MTNRESIEAAARRWVEGYVRAWGSNDPDDIRALFTDDATYYTTPFREPWSGAGRIAEEWVGRKDEPGTWGFTWDVVGVDGTRVFVQGETTYTDDNDYSNLWVIDLADDGRARSFTEWWMDQPDDD